MSVQRLCSVFVMCLVAWHGVAAFAAEAYDLLKTLKLTARSTYYQLSWTAMTLAFMTGEYTDLTREKDK